MNTFLNIRKTLGLTQAAMAQRIGVTQGNVAHYERGQTVPPSVAKKLIATAAELGHSITFNDVYEMKKPIKSRRSTDKKSP